MLVCPCTSILSELTPRTHHPFLFMPTSPPQWCSHSCTHKSRGPISGSNQALPLGVHGLPVSIRWLYGQPGSVIVGGVFGHPAGSLEKAKLGIGKSMHVIKSLASDQLVGMESKELTAEIVALKTHLSPWITPRQMPDIISQVRLRSPCDPFLNVNCSYYVADIWRDVTPPPQLWRTGSQGLAFLSNGDNLPETHC